MSSTKTRKNLYLKEKDKIVKGVIKQIKNDFIWSRLKIGNKSTIRETMKEIYEIMKLLLIEMRHDHFRRQKDIAILWNGGECSLQ